MNLIMNLKVTVTVCVYLLFLYDQWYKEGTWEMLDDSVYYVKVSARLTWSLLATSPGKIF